MSSSRSRGNTKEKECLRREFIRDATRMSREMNNTPPQEITPEQLPEEDQPERSALEMSPEALKAAIKKKEGNIFVFTDDKARRQSTASASGSNVNEDDLEIKHSVSSLSNPSQIEELPTPVSQGGYLSGHFNYADAEKMIGDQYDTRAIMTPFTPKGSGNGTPSGRRSNDSFSSPVSVTRGRSSCINNVCRDDCSFLKLSLLGDQLKSILSRGHSESKFKK